MKRLNFEISTVQSKTDTETGMQRGGRGAVAQSSDSQVSDWLGRQRPADMDAAALSRASLHGVGLKVRYEGRYPVGPGGDALPSYRMAVGCEAHGDADAMARALADLRNFMTPATSRQIEGWLARMSVVVAKRQDDAFGDELRVVEYASRLGRYPADVVHHALLGKSWQWWPTWAELERECEAMTAPRRQMIAALERGPVPVIERRPPTPEERARIQALIDEMFPGQPAKVRVAAVDHVLQGNTMSGPNMAGFDQ